MRKVVEAVQAFCMRRPKEAAITILALLVIVAVQGLIVLGR